MKSYFAANNSLLEFAASNHFVGLSITEPNRDGSNVTEPSSGGYARVGIQDGFADPVDGILENNVAIAFPQTTGPWAAGSPLTHAVIFDAPTGGNLIRIAQLTPPMIAASAGIDLGIAPGQLIIVE